nr:apolipoprotein N-acyltransferase [Propionibacteriales bacterium]
MPRAVGFDVLWRAAVAAAGGLAAAWAFPPYDTVWLLPIGLAAFIAATPVGRARAGFAVGLAFGLGLMLPLLRWITVIGPDAWIALSALEAAFYGLLGIGWTWVRSLRGWPLGFAACWVAAEELRSLVPFGGLPWGRLAFALLDTPVVRYGRLGGTALVSFATVLAVGLVVAAILRRRADTVAVAALGVAAAVVLAGMLVPVGVFGPGQLVTVAAIQGNVPGTGMNPFAERRAVLDNHVAATRQLAADVRAGAAPRPDLVVWPENSTDIDPFGNASVRSEIDGGVRTIGVPTLVGAVIAGPDGDHLQNVGIVWDPRSGPGERYVKRHVVPFGEYIPFRGFATQFISRLDQIPLDFARGSSPGVLQLGPARIGDVICFEVAYDGLIRDVVAGGAQLVVVQTNNATYTGTGQLSQQFAISRYRAIETGKSVVVAATSGISGIIAPDGTVVASSAVGTRAILQAEVQLAAGETLGVRVGGP